MVSSSSSDSESDDTWQTPAVRSTTGELLDKMPERDGCFSNRGVDLESGELERKVHLGKKRQMRDCRICHLRLVGEDGEHGSAIELGCSCKGDLAVAHKQCAETWFRIKGNT